MDNQNELENLSEPLKALIGNKALFHQFLDLLPIPIQIFAPDGLCIFYNRACMELNGVADANDIVGKYNYINDPVCLEIMGQDVYDRLSSGQVVLFPDFPAPIQDAVDRGVIAERQYEAATMDLFFLPLWDGQTYVCTVMFYTVKKMYHGHTDITKAQQYIETHWQDEFDLEKIAESINISKRHFQRLFKDAVNRTPIEYYQDIKIRKLQEKLLDDTLSIEQAFTDCRVEVHGAYHKLFKEKTGQTPSEYRKANLK